MTPQEKNQLQRKTSEYLRSTLPPVKASRISQLCTDIIERMQHDIARFSYVKNDGSTRTAYGTLDKEIITHYHAEPKTIEKPSTDKPITGTIRYFDTEKQAWRSFFMVNILTYDDKWDMEDSDQ